MNATDAVTREDGLRAITILKPSVRVRGPPWGDLKSLISFRQMAGRIRTDFNKEVTLQEAFKLE